MKIADNNGTFEVANVSEIHESLRKRCETDRNAFWIWHDQDEYPKLLLLVNHDVTALYYYANEGDAGYQSLDPMRRNLDKGTTSFAISPYRGDDVFIPNTAIISLSVALGVVQEFAVCKELPCGIKWFKL